MKRPWVWLQLLIGWLPIWALFTMLAQTGHPHAQFHQSVLLALRLMLSAATLALVVHGVVVPRLPWPHPMRVGFVALHLIGAGLFGAAWIFLNSLIESALRGELILAIGYGLGPYLVLGVWVYVMVAGVAYAKRATERAARAEAIAARSQLAALRAQLHPHFLFNVLHTVVQLIPSDPRRAGQAAELLAGLLRTAIEEDRDLVPLREEMAFVERYLEIERIRFGERLRVEVSAPDEAAEAQLPSYALQTLVENAVRHGAAPRVEPTTIAISAQLAKGILRVAVKDTGVGADAARLAATPGTGLFRLRERLAVLYGERAHLVIDTAPGQGFGATLELPA